MFSPRASLTRPQINGGQLLLYLPFGPETRYVRPGEPGYDAAAAPTRPYAVSLRRIDPTPLRATEFVSPLFLALRPCVLVPAAAYAMVFLFASVLVTVELPQLLAAKFELNVQQLGLQFLAIIVGSLLGEQIGGWVSDRWMRCGRASRSSQLSHPRAPEFRLWLAYPGFLLAIAGLVVFLVCIQQAPAGRWTISPLVGAAIAAAGNQIVTTVLVTYAVDCYSGRCWQRRRLCHVCAPDVGLHRPVLVRAAL